MDEILKQLNIDEIIAVQEKLKEKKVSTEASLAKINAELETASSLIELIDGKSS